METITARNKAVVRRFNKEVIEGRDLSLMDELFSPAFVNRSVKPGFSAGIGGMVGFLELFWQAFSGLRVELHDQVAEGDRVTTRKTIHGRHTGDFLQRPASNQEIEIQVIDIVRLENGKYLEHWNVIDMQKVLDQMRP